jgi:hypothetical protein
MLDAVDDFIDECNALITTADFRFARDSGLMREIAGVPIKAAILLEIPQPRVQSHAIFLAKSC